MWGHVCVPQIEGSEFSSGGTPPTLVCTRWKTAALFKIVHALQFLDGKMIAIPRLHMHCNPDGKIIAIQNCTCIAIQMVKSLLFKIVHALQSKMVKSLLFKIVHALISRW